MTTVAPLGAWTLLTDWDVPVAGAIAVGLAALGYGWAAARAGSWPARRTCAFSAGLIVVLFALGSGVNTYSSVLFTVHMAQHLLLIMVAPALLLFGQPFELLPRGGAVVAAAAHPICGFALYTVVVVGTHLTPFLQGALTVPALHGVEEAGYVLAGLLLLLPILGVRPRRRPTPYLMRLVLLFAAMVVDAVVGVALMMTPHEPFPAYAAVARHWGPGLVEDLHWGGAMMWVGGDALMAVLAVVVIGGWLRSAERGDDLGSWLENARRSALELGDGTRVDEDEDALRAYNTMLARLSDRDARR
ncbi:MULTISPECIES: cytochrome c oxidase assembly protein [unclassified Amycolatopsis]|uniref:cytochrome c oxidase assembly protein n=1 Tax=unclassified Amycolatopsis TaxID=2618356 RepID=UPI001C696B82|nr:cytochrome c oxidase assembly protein [Amycolatopsis sp. DSM 110486]QYN20370.1 cytochrome c oxidase assembly protein [Amycolatopsis sp. DSM 110486]